MIRRLLLLFLFLFAQAGALAHGIGHATGHEDQGLDHRAACELCVAYAPLGAGVASAAFAWAPPAADFSFPAVPATPAAFAFRPLYLSRAPPL
jgi:hypothetical protein